MRRILAVALPACLLLADAPPAHAQSPVDPQLVEEIARIKAIDNHAHPTRLVAPGETDPDWDALTVDGLEEFPLPLRLRPDNPEFRAACRALYGVAPDVLTDAGIASLLEARRRVTVERGDGYPAWVLDQIGVETMLANRVAMGRGLEAPRFRWVSFVDALIFPLDTVQTVGSNPDRRAFFPGVERLNRRYLSEAGVPALPASLDEYVRKVLVPTLERHKREGAVAVKFEAAYLRSLDFAPVSEAEAARVYGRYARGGTARAAEYKAVQNYLFHRTALEAGRLGLPVHIHVGLGLGGYFDLAGSNPTLLIRSFDDPSLRKTTFVLIHSGWPFAAASTALLTRPNVYVDFSAQTFLTYPRQLADVIRAWLEFVPEKVLFGTDAFEIVPFLGWEVTAWLTAASGRQALAIALTAMMNDGEITRARALELARMVLRGNALRLYGLAADRSPTTWRTVSPAPPLPAARGPVAAGSPSRRPRAPWRSS